MRQPVERRDPGELPSYVMVEAAHYVGVPMSTLRWWVSGRDHYDPIIMPASSKPVLLSFLNLVELHVLAAIRRRHKVPLPKVRAAVRYLGAQFGTEHPLLAHQLQADGLDLFVEYYGKLVNISREGQVAMRSMLQFALRRVERDPAGVPIKLYPFTSTCATDSAPSLIVIDPQVSGGRPVITGTGVPTEVVAERHKAGESIEGLAADYGRPEVEIEEALRCELQAAA